MDGQNANTVHQFDWGTLEVSAGVINDLNLSPAPSKSEDIEWSYPVKVMWINEDEASDRDLPEPDEDNGWMKLYIDPDQSEVRGLAVTDTSDDFKDEMYRQLHAKWLDGGGKIPSLFEESVDIDFLEERGIGQLAVHSTIASLRYKFSPYLFSSATRQHNQHVKTSLLNRGSAAITSLIAAGGGDVVAMVYKEPALDVYAGSLTLVSLGVVAHAMYSIRKQVKAYFNGMPNRATELSGKAISMELDALYDMHGAYCLTHTSDAIDSLLAQALPEE